MASRRARVGSRLAAIGLAGTLASCSVGDADPPIDGAIAHVALAWCDLLERCGCVLADCGELQESYRRSWLFVDSDLVFDPHCAQSLAERIRQSSSCDPDFDASNLNSLAPTCEHPCSLFHGSAFEGEDCVSRGSFSNCAAGLVCAAGRCTDPCHATAGREGEPCLSGCDEGLYCVSDIENPDPGYCTRLPGPGQPCTPFGECNDDARCEDPFSEDARCVRLGEDDDPCTGHAQCRSGHCPSGRCTPRLSEGQACTDNLRCAEGLACQEGICQAALASICYRPDAID